MKQCWYCEYFKSGEKCEGCKNTKEKPNFVLWKSKKEKESNKNKESKNNE